MVGALCRGRAQLAAGALAMVAFQPRFGAHPPVASGAGSRQGALPQRGMTKQRASESCEGAGAVDDWGRAQPATSVGGIVQSHDLWHDVGCLWRGQLDVLARIDCGRM